MKKTTRWMILINEEEKGPFYDWELCHLPFFDLDTLIRKVGDKEWKKVKDVKELSYLFEEEKEEEEGQTPSPFQDILVADYERRPKGVFLLLLLLLLGIYFLVRNWI